MKHQSSDTVTHRRHNMCRRLSVALLTLFVVLTGCEDFLDTVNKTKKDTGNYPQTPAEATQLLTGVYSILGRPEPLGSSFMTSELMSDDRLGGGDENDKTTKAIDQFKKSSNDMFNSSWRAHYFGVFRSNFLLATLDGVAWSSEQQRNTVEGEARFLRAHFYFDLSRMFGRVPLVVTPEPVNLPQAPAAETYALIASDLKKAIELLPPVKYDDINKDADLGRITRWAAQAMMARVFLFYTGYYRTETLPLTGGGAISREQVTDWIVDCIDNSGHDLVDDFRNLWPYAYVRDYKYTADNNLQWEGDGHRETVFAIKYSAVSYNFDSPQQKSNQFCLYFGLRSQSSDHRLTFPFGTGWGHGTVNHRIWDEWDDADLRKKASVLYVKDPDEIQKYDVGGQLDETMYWQKKYVPINVWKDAEKTIPWNFSHELYAMTRSDYMCDNIQDLVLIRFADVLLMAAELGAPQAQQYLDRVRGRVNLPPVSSTLENIKRERRFELAFEGVRYYDLLRWHDWDALTVNQTGITIYNRMGRPQSQKKSIVFRPETGGFLPIPQTQIDLSGGVLTQNPGWEGAEHNLD
jgi:hypothetical protein